MFARHDPPDDPSAHTLPARPSGPNFITDRVAIGGRDNAANETLAARLGFRSYLRLTDSGGAPAHCEALLERAEYVRLVDGPGNDYAAFEQAVNTLRTLAREHEPVLVYCFAGRSRSASVVAAWLAVERGLPIEDAVLFIKDRRDIDIHPEMLALARHYVTDRTIARSASAPRTEAPDS